MTDSRLNKNAFLPHPKTTATSPPTHGDRLAVWLSDFRTKIIKDLIATHASEYIEKERIPLTAIKEAEKVFTRHAHKAWNPDFKNSSDLKDIAIDIHKKKYLENFEVSFYAAYNTETIRQHLKNTILMPLFGALLKKLVI